MLKTTIPMMQIS